MADGFLASPRRRLWGVLQRISSLKHLLIEIQRLSVTITSSRSPYLWVVLLVVLVS